MIQSCTYSYIKAQTKSKKSILLYPSKRLELSLEETNKISTLLIKRRIVFVPSMNHNFKYKIQVTLSSRCFMRYLFRKSM